MSRITVGRSGLSGLALVVSLAVSTQAAADSSETSYVLDGKTWNFKVPMAPSLNTWITLPTPVVSIASSAPSRLLAVAHGRDKDKVNDGLEPNQVLLTPQPGVSIDSWLSVEIKGKRGVHIQLTITFVREPRLAQTKVKFTLDPSTDEMLTRLEQEVEERTAGEIRQLRDQVAQLEKDLKTAVDAGTAAGVKQGKKEEREAARQRLVTKSCSNNDKAYDESEDGDVRLMAHEEYCEGSVRRLVFTLNNWSGNRPYSIKDVEILASGTETPMGKPEFHCMQGTLLAPGFTSRCVAEFEPIGDVSLFTLVVHEDGGDRLLVAKQIKF